MEPKASDTETTSLSQPQNMPYGYMNGVSDFILPSRKESGRNVPENLLARTVENVMLDMEKEENIKQSSNDPHVQDLDLPNHASQLLKAAASAVSNSFRSDAQLQQNGQGSTSAPAYGSTSSHENMRFANDRSPNSDYSSGPPDNCSTSQTSNQMTAVSIASKLTMSTGFTSSSASLPVHALGSLNQSTALTDSSISPKREPTTVQVVVPFLWRRCLEEGSISYYR